MNRPRPGYLLSPRATILALSGVLLGMLLAALNQTIVATALPRITGELGGLAHYSWVFSAYAGESGFTAAFVMGTIALGVAFLAALLIPGRVREPRELQVASGAR